MKLNSNISIVVSIVFFGIIYSLISIVNHYNFRTFALDLGAYSNALYDYIHFQWNDSSVFKEVNENLLSDHFDIYLMLLSPFSLLFKSYTLLWAQIFFILLGGFGIYKYILSIGSPDNLALFAAIYFYLFFGVFAAVSFDYHSNVIAAAIVPWFIYYLSQKKVLATTVLLFLIIISKENVSLWLAFICLGLMIEYWNIVYWRTYLIFAFLLCIVYFVVITTIVMPALSNSNTYPHFNYSLLGNNALNAILFLVEHPFISLKSLFINHLNHPNGDYVKAEFHVLVFISGLPLLIFKPQYIVMLIPVYFQKLYNDNYTIWGIDGQYSIEFAPILAIGIFSVLKEFRSKKLVATVTIIVLIAALSCTVRIMDHTLLYTNKAKIRIYNMAHYSREYDVKMVYEQIEKIPADAIISAQSPFLPHLALRDNIYQFPIIKNAEYVIYSVRENLYPLDLRSFELFTSQLESSDEWKLYFKDENLTILAKANR